MIKTNKPQQVSILRSGYRNQLKKHSQNSSSIKSSHANRNDFQDGIKSSVSKQTGRLNQNKSQSSHKSRTTSVQRALNTAFGTHQTHNQPSQVHHVDFQIQSLVRQNYPFVPPAYHYKKSIQRHPSEPIAQLNRSQAGSDVNTQIQTLNRLRQEHEIIKQVTSDDERRDYENGDVSKSNANQSKDFSRRKYIYESREPVPVQGIKNKTLGKIAPTVNQSRANKNPQKQENDEYSVSSENQAQQANPNIEGNRKQQKQSDIAKNRQQTIANHREYLIQISSLQSALTQSSLKIEQLLTESLKNKEKLKQYQQVMDKAHRLQNEMKMMKQGEKYMKREIEMKEEEVQRFEKRTKIMKQTMEMMEREAELKDKEISALQGLILSNKLGTFDKFNHSSDSYEQQLEKIKQFAKQKQWMRAEIQSELRKKERNNSQGLSSHFESLQNIRDRLKLTQQKLNQVQSSNLKLTLDLETQKQKSTQLLQQTISSRIKYELAHSNVSSSKQEQPNNTESYVNKQIQSIRQELSKLQASTKQNASSQSYVNQLETKLRQLEEVMRSENEEKMRFVREIQRVRDEQRLNGEKIATYAREVHELRQENQFMRKENELAKSELSALQSYNASLTKLQSQITVNYIPKEKHAQVQRQRQALSQQLATALNELNSLKRQLSTKAQQPPAIQSLTPQQQQQLLQNLNEIKQEYLKLQQAYFQKAKQCQQAKLESYSRQSLNAQEMETELRQLQEQLQAERHYAQQLQEKVREKEFKLIEFLNLAQNTNTYNEKIAELHTQVSALQVKLKEKDCHISQLLLQHKKQLNLEKQTLNQLHLELSQKTLQTIEIKNTFEQQHKINQHLKENLTKQLNIKKHQLQEQQKNFDTLTKMEKDMTLQQVKLLEAQIFTLILEKEKLMEETLKMSHLEYQFRALVMKERSHKKLSESIDHLWMIKEAEYFNVHQILNLIKPNPRQEKSRVNQQDHPIKISEDY